MSFALLQFVMYMKSPILEKSIPVWEGENMSLDSWCKMAFLCLQPANYHTLMLLITFLREYLVEQQKGDVDQLAYVWGRAFTHSDPDGTFSGSVLLKPVFLAPVS